MKKLLASILLIAFIGQTFNQGWYCLGYLIEKKEYMKRCVNKARAEMRCEGQCQLMKKIKEQEEKEHGQPPELKLAAKILLLSPKDYLFTPSVNAGEKAPVFLIRSIGIPVHRSSTLFHPPDLA